MTVAWKEETMQGNCQKRNNARHIKETCNDQNKKRIKYT